MTQSELAIIIAVAALGAALLAPVFFSQAITKDNRKDFCPFYTRCGGPKQKSKSKIKF